MRAGCPVIHAIRNSDKVRGLTACHNKLYVLRDAYETQVDTYDIHTYQFRKRRFVAGNDLWDMTCSMRDDCLYMSNFKMKKLHKVIVAGLSAELTLNDFEPRGLAVMSNGNLLVTCRSPNALLEVDGDGGGVIVNTILLPKSVEVPWHAVQLSTGNFAVCHGCGLKRQHGVSIVERSGHVTRSYGNKCGSRSDQLNVPCHLAVDEDDFIFVADCFNKRVTLLSPTLAFMYHLTDQMSYRPQRLCLDRVAQRLYVCQRFGDVLVMQL